MSGTKINAKILFLPYSSLLQRSEDYAWMGRKVPVRVVDEIPGELKSMPCTVLSQMLKESLFTIKNKEIC